MSDLLPLPLLTLQRTQQDMERTFGHIAEADGHLIVPATLELPWQNNARDVSCVPATGPDAWYTAERYFSPGHGYEVFRLIDVPARDYVELHIANITIDVRGCIGLGSAFGTLYEHGGKPIPPEPGITGSSAAFTVFMAFHRESRCRLRVLDAPSADTRTAA